MKTVERKALRDFVVNESDPRIVVNKGQTYRTSMPDMGAAINRPEPLPIDEPQVEVFSNYWYWVPLSVFEKEQSL